jgi:hypothetical protein
MAVALIFAIYLTSAGGGRGGGGGGQAEHKQQSRDVPLDGEKLGWDLPGVGMGTSIISAELECTLTNPHLHCIYRMARGRFDSS